MKIKFTRPDGTVVEAEGTPEECARFAGLRSEYIEYVYDPAIHTAPSPPWHRPVIVQPAPLYWQPRTCDPLPLPGVTYAGGQSS